MPCFQAPLLTTYDDGIVPRIRTARQLDAWVMAGVVGLGVQNSAMEGTAKQNQGFEGVGKFRLLC